jgi:hypothetical protein
MMACVFVCCPVTHYSSSREPTKIVREDLDAVAHKAQSAIFKVHPKEVAGEILFGDVGMLL